MGLFKITAKKSGNWGGVIIEKGMSAEVVEHNNPLGTNKGKDKVRQAFQSKYGINLKNCASLAHFDVEKIN